MFFWLAAQSENVFATGPKAVLADLFLVGLIGYQYRALFRTEHPATDVAPRQIDEIRPLPKRRRIVQDHIERGIGRAVD